VSVHYLLNARAPAGFFSRVGKLGVWDESPPAGAQGWSPGGGLGAKPQEDDDKLWK